MVFHSELHAKKIGLCNLQLSITALHDLSHPNLSQHYQASIREKSLKKTSTMCTPTLPGVASICLLWPCSWTNLRQIVCYRAALDLGAVLQLIERLNTIYI